MAGILLTILVLAACDASDATPTPSASVEVSPSESVAASASELASASADAGEGGTETSVFDLANGDCFDASGDQVDTVTVLDCEASHTYEVFAIFDHEAGIDAPYPGDEALLEYADSACQPYFEEYVGIAYADSRYWITSVTPSRETWEEGDDREIVCALKLGEDAEATTGSAEGSGQ